MGPSTLGPDKSLSKVLKLIHIMKSTMNLRKKNLYCACVSERIKMALMPSRMHGNRTLWGLQDCRPREFVQSWTPLKH